MVFVILEVEVCSVQVFGSVYTVPTTSGIILQELVLVVHAANAKKWLDLWLVSNF